MEVPILKQGEFLIATIQAALSDADLEQLRMAVERDIAGGVPAAVAASVRARVLSGSPATTIPITPRPQN